MSLAVARYGPMSLVAGSTEVGYINAEKFFSKFAIIQNYPQLNDFSKQHIKGDIKGVPKIQRVFLEFGTFLLNALSEQTNSNLAPGSQRQYFSGVKTLFMKKFPHLAMFQRWNLDWYNEIYAAIRNRGNAAAIKRGEPLEKRTKGVHAQLLESICDALMKEGTSDAMEERSVLLSLYHSVGRGGEVSTSNWESATWEVIHEQSHFGLNWGETKGGKDGLLTFYPDAKSFQMCFVHGMASYLVTATGKFGAASVADDQPSWIFSA